MPKGMPSSGRAVPARQRSALDAFAGDAHGAVLAAYRTAWSERQRLAAELDELVAGVQERTREAELLRIGLAEVERVDPQPGEDLELAHEAERLGHAEDLRQAAQAAHDALTGGDDAQAQLGAAALELFQVGGGRALRLPLRD